MIGQSRDGFGQLKECFCVSSSLSFISCRPGSLIVIECFLSWYRIPFPTNSQIGPSSAVMVLFEVSVWCCADFQARKLVLE